MSFIPIQNAKNSKSEKITKFLGLNRGENTSISEFSDMKNLSSIEFPFISSSYKEEEDELMEKIIVNENGEEIEKKAENIRVAFHPRDKKNLEGFTGVIGTTFYYNGRAKQMRKSAIYSDDGKLISGMDIAPDGKIKLLWSNRVILILGYDSSIRDPYLYYYDTSQSTGGVYDVVRCAEYDGDGELSERSFTINSEGRAFIHFLYKTNRLFQGNYYNVKVGDSVFMDGFMAYKDSRWQSVYADDIISATVVSYTENLSAQNGSEYTWVIDMEIELFNEKGVNPLKKGESYTFYNISRKIPYMNDITLHKGRLWGTNPNGEMVYASSLGDIFNFSKFEGISDDSAFLESSSQGDYKAIASFGDSIITFKENEMEVIYGEFPTEFAVGKSFGDIGCDDEKSVCSVGGVLYFLSGGKFYAFNGINYEVISEKLRKNYQNAFSYKEGDILKISALSDDGWEVLSYDAKRKLWHKGDNEEIVSHFKYKTEDYILKNDKIYKVSKSKKEESFEAESVKIFVENLLPERVFEMWFLLSAKKDSHLEIFTSVDGGEWISELKKTFSKDEYKTIRVPVRLSEGEYFQYKLKINGDVFIKSIEIIYNDGGRCYSNERSR